MQHSKIIVLLGLMLVGIIHFSAIPLTIWEYDECLYAAAVEEFAPLRHHPPPPGSPVYIGVLKVVSGIWPRPLTAMLITSAVSVLAGFLAFVGAFGAMTDRRTGTVGALLLYTSPAVLVSGTLPQADSGALALLGGAIWAAVRAIERVPPPGSAALAAALAALAVGWRPQLSLMVVPMFCVTLALMSSGRARAIAIGVFGAVCVGWLAPLVLATGGVGAFWSWISGQAIYFARHDADLSRSGRSAVEIGLRFIAHPWGPKWLSLPFLALAFLGVRRNRRLLPIAVGCLAYLLFALMTMDPADAVRYAIPSLPLLALLAATTLTSSHPMLGLVALLYAAGASWYASPLLRVRASSPSPPALAAEWIGDHAVPGTIVLYDLPLRPHAEYLLRDLETMRVDEGLARFGADPAQAMVLLADGERGGARGVTFRWPDTDAYRKLTRQHYGAVSVIRLSAAERFHAMDGIFAPERTRDGRAWRWLSAHGVLELPSLGASQVRLAFRIPPEYPFPQNRIRVVSGASETTVLVRRGAAAETVVPIEPGPARITLIPEFTFVPAEIAGARNRDRRRLSVMLTHVEQMVPRRGE